MDLTSLAPHLQAREAAHQFSGVVLITQGDDTVWSGAYGLASRAWSIPNTLATRFDTASITKLFTAVAVLQLVDEGRLALDTRVIERLGLSGTAISPDVTVYHLLTHTSGIADDAEEENGELYEDVWKTRANYWVRETRDFLPQFAYKPPNFPPGQGCRYCNVSYILLGLLIEQASGLPYRDYVCQHIFAPAGMAHSDFFALDRVEPNVAEGADPLRDETGAVTGWKRNLYSFPPIGSPDSGAHVTAADLDRFLRRVQAGQLLAPALTQAFFTPQVHYRAHDGWDQWYGCGLWFHLDPAGQIVCYQKEGTNTGVSGMIRRYPAHDLNVVILSNMEDGAWEPMREIHRRIMERPARSFHSGRLENRMSAFTYLDGALHCEAAPLAPLAAQYGTPLYVYSAGAIRANYRRLALAFAPLSPLICFAVKANFNLALLRLLKEEGAGFDIVSGGELYRALRAGADSARIVFAGVGKTDAELNEALVANVGWFNVESADEAARLNARALALGRRATVALRLNPGVDPDTHHHIRTGGSGSKFGIPVPEALALAARWRDFPALDLCGVHIHIGSQVPDAAPTLAALEVALDFARQVPSIDHVDLGGGFPVPYRDGDHYAPIEEFAAPLVERLRPLAGQYSFHLEPGRYIVANAGVLLATVQAVKDVAGRRTLILDAGMHTLLRPALYDAHHRTLPLRELAGDSVLTDLAGPICESADVLARDRALPLLLPGDTLALLDAGAYGFAMASNYNSQPRPAEVLVDGDAARLIRRRETYDDLIAQENGL